MFKVIFCKAPEVYLFYTKQIFEGKKDFILRNTEKFIGVEKTNFVFFKKAHWAKQKGIWPTNKVPKELVFQIYWITDEKARNEIALFKNLAG